MAAMDRVLNNLSASCTQPQYKQKEDKMAHVTATATAAFIAGFSGGVAAQVHFAKYLPRPAKAALVVPTVLGAVSSSTVYKHELEKYRNGSCPLQLKAVSSGQAV